MVDHTTGTAPRSLREDLVTLTGLLPDIARHHRDLHPAGAKATEALRRAPAGPRTPLSGGFLLLDEIEHAGRRWAAAAGMPGATLADLHVLVACLDPAREREAQATVARWVDAAQALLGIDTEQPSVDPAKGTCPADGTALRMAPGWDTGDPLLAEVQCPACHERWPVERAARRLVNGAEGARRLGLSRNVPGLWRARHRVGVYGRCPATGGPLYDLAELEQCARGDRVAAVRPAEAVAA